MAEEERRGLDALQERARRRARLALGYRERLAWLEEAKRFAERALAAAAERRRSAAPEGTQGARADRSRSGAPGAP